MINLDLLGEDIVKMKPSNRTIYEAMLKEEKDKLETKRKTKLMNKLRKKAEFDAKPPLEKAKIIGGWLSKSFDKITKKLKEKDTEWQKKPL